MLKDDFETVRAALEFLAELDSQDSENALAALSRIEESCKPMSALEYEAYAAMTRVQDFHNHGK